MDDLKFGKRNKRGDWTPSEPLKTGPLFELPFRTLAVLQWVKGYFFPWNLLFMASACVFWFCLTPSWETMKTLSWEWIALLTVRNLVAVFLFYGAFELRLYVQRRQGNRFKFNGKFPGDVKSDVFFFGNQNIDNMIRGLGTGVPIWTTYEVLILWAFANGYVPMADLSTNAWWLAGIVVLLPMFHELHFYLVHRAIHIPILYKYVHSVHHNSINPSPWSSLSMHPVEHLLYFSGTLIHLVIYSHPLLAIYHLHFAGFGAVVGHVGFDKIETSDESAIDTHAFAHYLHHRYFEVNYADGGIPFDRWFGTWHDGTPEGDRLMNERWEKKRARVNAGQTESNT
ncbi:sterol desaturase family protein [Rhizobium leguminosarum]|uniref:sterol desaturase family protein n=1 Tax=Rhizobium leguminosarum TaxID=384 RepID=UPI001C97289E|nr:sterol desaturase family protein [Rhizobium leguminosarum]MBY5460839.1 sterol desaturase family protein [Rhizobium leguminosarum]